MNMRIILIIQTLIILASAYYIFTLSQTSKLEGSPNLIATPIIKDKIVPKNETSKISGNMTTDLSASSSKDIKNNSANDYGMEYPIVDNDPQVR